MKRLQTVLLCLLIGFWGCANKTKNQSKGMVDPKITDSGIPMDSDQGDQEIQELIQNDLDDSGRELAELNPVFFDYDRSEIRGDQTATLENDARWMREHPEVRVLIEGHCDERGTDEYNLALGDQRASVARDYLLHLGISERRMSTITYGESRPFANGHQESAWSQNRRAHLVEQQR